MTIIRPSRSICEGADPTVPTLEQVLERLGNVQGLSSRVRADCRSALRSLGRIMGRPLGEIPASPPFLRSRLDELSPARFGLSRGRWANICSLVLKALKVAGVAALPSRHVSPLSPEWQQLYDLLPKRPQGVNLSRLMHRCSELGVAPQDVAQETFERFADELEHFGLRSSPRQAYRDACRAWNWAVNNVPGWPRTIIVVPDRRNRYSRPWESFPPSLKSDIDAMLEAAISPDLLSPTSRRPIKAISARSRLTLLRRLASALVVRGRDPLTLHSIADLVDPEAVREGLRFFLERSGGKRTADIHQTAKLMCTLAKHWVGVPADHLAELVVIRRRLDPGRHGMTAKNRAALRCFEDEVLVEKFVDLSETIARRHRNRSDIKVRDAVEVQIALAIELLTVAPVRCGNLASIHLDCNLVRIGASKDAQVHLHFPADAVKNEIELEFPLPRSTIDLLDLYVSKFRPELVRAANDWLFPGEAGGPKQGALLGNQVAKTLEREIGVRLTAHQFRHLAGYLYLKRNPGGHEVVRRLLGHKSIDTTTRFYAGMEVSEAIRHYDKHIESRRAELAEAKWDAKSKRSRRRRHG
jgi:integrase